jgi:hypothetical protein
LLFLTSLETILFVSPQGDSWVTLQRVQGILQSKELAELHADESAVEQEPDGAFYFDTNASYFLLLVVITSVVVFGGFPCCHQKLAFF